MDPSQPCLRRRGIRAPSRRAAAGYSLHDLLVTTGIAGFLGLGGVSMAGLVQDTRLTAAVNELMGNLNLARSEAIKRGSAVTLCKTENGANCAKGSAWHTGWIVFEDTNTNRQVDDNETIIQIKQSLNAVALNFSGSFNHDRYVTYHPSGRSEPNGTFTFCDNRGAGKAKAVILLGSGRPRTSALNSKNKPLECL